MAKAKCKCPKPGLTAPFYLLTYGDMMTLLLTFFVLMFSMSTIQVAKFQAQISVMQGSLGISKLYRHAPMQKSLPAPAVKQHTKVIAKTETSKPKNTPAREVSDSNSRQNSRQNDKKKSQSLKSLGTQTKRQINENKQQIILVLPSYGIFDRGEWIIDPNRPEVKRVTPMYKSLAQQISYLTDYDISFVGHTDATPVAARPEGPKNNMELGFKRAVALFEYFFSDDLTDMSRLSFSSQGDNVPLVPHAAFDSERRKNRRVEVHLNKRNPEG